MVRVAMVEDNERLRTLLREALMEADITVDDVGTIAEFRDLVQSRPHDLYIIDFGLPDGDGLELIPLLRETNRGLPPPILAITARGQISDRVRGLNLGADDYLVKPFHHAEFVARVKALQRRPRLSEQMQIQAGRLILDPVNGEVSCDGQVIPLRRAERRLLGLFMRRLGHVVPRELIESNLVDYHEGFTPNALDKLVSRLRKSLGDLPAGLELKTIKGSGYQLMVQANDRPN
jgi:two-component system, OmpR family, response regulator